MSVAPAPRAKFKRTRRTLLRSAVMLAAPLIAGCAIRRDAKPDAVQFVVLGDAPYNAREEAQMTRLLAELPNTPHDFVVHVGDIKDGSNQRCDDTLNRERYALFARNTKPFVLLPGDNDWTDCRRPGAGGFAPLERLAALRQVFFAPASNLARGLKASQHATLPELMHWRVKGVEFVALHVVGSRDNQGFDTDGDREQAVRMEANLAWLAAADARATATDATALVVIFHVNPVFEMPPPVFQPLIAALGSIATRSTRPMLLVHGDTHTYQFDQALIDVASGRPFAHVWRLESFGSPQVGMVKVSISGRPARFAVEPWVVPVEA